MDWKRVILYAVLCVAAATVAIFAKVGIDALMYHLHELVGVPYVATR